MNNTLLARAQELLERSQEKMNKADERSQNIESQLAGLSQRVHVLEGHIALMRAQAMQALERAGRTNGQEETN